MKRIRTFLQSNIGVATLILALALAMKAFVPAGYMVGSTAAKTLSVMVCDGQGNDTVKQIAVGGRSDGGANDHSKAAKECPFTALSMHSLSGTDPVLLVLALAFILALGFVPVPPIRIERRAFLTPPLRGPPVLS